MTLQRASLIAGLLAATAIVGGASPRQVRDGVTCTVTAPNHKAPPAPPEGPVNGGPALYGNDSLATFLWPNGTVTFKPGGPGYVLADGALQMKFLWWKVKGALAIEGRRLDDTAPPLRSTVTDGFEAQLIQPSYLIFPTTGCWEVTGRIGDASLTFVTRVEKIGAGPSRYTAW